MRRLIEFACEGETLVASLDEAPGDTALLIVSGGNEVRAGAHRGMALLAARLAARGHPVLRFDRRGVGDSSGSNGGYANSAPDLTAAASLLRSETRCKRLFALGNCDAATALTLFGEAAGLDALILTNPWLPGSSNGDLPPAAAIRARYLARLRDPRSWLRPPSPLKLVKGLLALAKSPSQLSPPKTKIPTTVILAAHDATAQAYQAAIKVSFVRIDTASHSFADAPDQLEAAVVEALERYSAASASSANSAA